MSPGDRSYDAIGLMKQISEQTAAQYASAHEILGNETPKALPKDAPGNNRDGDQENNDLHSQHGNHSQLASSALVKLKLSPFSFDQHIHFCLVLSHKSQLLIFP